MTLPHNVLEINPPSSRVSDNSDTLCYSSHVLELKGAQIPSYRDLKKGIHPDIPEAVAARMPKIERRHLAITLTLRDLFTPLCEDLYRATVSLNPEEVREISTGFERQPKIFPFARSHDELVSTLWSEADEYHEIKAARESRGQIETIDERGAKDLVQVLELMTANTKPKKTDLDCVPGRFEEFYFTSAELERAQRWDTLFIPVGAYGRAPARKLLEAGRILMKIANSALAEAAYELATKHEGILKETTARARKYIPFEGRSSEENRYYPLLTVEEGIESLLGDIAFLLPEKIEGIDNGDTAVVTIINRRLPNQVAGRIPMGFLMPKIRAGRYLPGIITTKRGKPELSVEAEKLFDERMSEERYKRDHPEAILEEFPAFEWVFREADLFLKDLERLGVDPDEMASLGGEDGFACPVARTSRLHRKSGVQLTSEALLHIYNAL